jgi:hypothetical protein
MFDYFEHIVLEIVHNVVSIRDILMTLEWSHTVLRFVQARAKTAVYCQGDPQEDPFRNLSRHNMNFPTPLQYPY